MPGLTHSLSYSQRMTTMKVERWQLRQRRAEPLEIKIQMSKERIKQWVSHWDGEAHVAFSGGLDSTVLLHMSRSIYPDMPASFNNTGVEFPEIIKFVRSTEDIHWQRPKKRFPQIIKEYGYPVISKRIAQYVSQVQRAKGDTATKRLRLTGYKSNGEYTSMGKISNKWQYLCHAPFPISDKCCAWLKKKPGLVTAAVFGPPILGIRTDESQQREQIYYSHGCNAYDLTSPRSWPLAFWTHQDVLDYLELYEVPYCSLYDKGWTSSGCFPCMFGVHMEGYPNRFQRMHDTHPKLWKYCMDTLGLREVLAYVGIPTEPWM